MSRKKRRRSPWMLIISVLTLGAVSIALFYPRIRSRNEDTVAAPETTEQIPDTVRIKVLNGADIEDLARTVERYLAREGTPVVFFSPGNPSNANRRNYEQTVIVSHRRDLAGGILVAEQLGLTDSSVVWQVSETDSGEIDVTVYLGRDMAGRSFIPYSN